MAKSMIARNVCKVLRNNYIPSTAIMNVNIMPNPLNSLYMLPSIPEKAEVLDKWNKTPKPDTQKEWIKNIMFNKLVF